MLERELLIERIGRFDDLQLAAVKWRSDLEDMQRDRLALRRKGCAITRHEHHEALAATAGSECIGIHRGVRAIDFAQRAGIHVPVLRRVRDIDAAPGWVFLEGFQRGLQSINRGVPLSFPRVRARAECLGGGAIVGRQDVELEILLTHRLVFKLTDKDQRTFRTHGGVEIQPLAEMRWKVREVSLSEIQAGRDRRRERIERDRRERVFLRAGRIVQPHAARSVWKIEAIEIGIECDGLLVEHPRTALPAHGGQAVLRQGQCFADG